MNHPLWNQAWDVAFALASGLLAFCFGAALGNVLRGVSIGDDGNFFAPLWNRMDMSDPVGVLDPYTILVGLTTVVILSMHGAMWLSSRTEGEVRRRAAKLRQPLLLGTGLMLVAVTVATWVVQPQLSVNLAQRPVGMVVPALGLGALGVVGWACRAERSKLAFRASCAFVGALFGSAAYAVFPMVLPARDPALSLMAADAAADAYGLGVALYWWIPGMAIATGYFVFLYRKMPATFGPDDDAH